MANHTIKPVTPRLRCPTCGRAFARTKTPVPAPADPAQLTDVELYAYYKRTAAVEDLRFMLRHARLSDDLTRDAEQSLVTGPTHTSNARLRQRWRQEHNLSELADRVQVTGTGT